LLTLGVGGGLVDYDIRFLSNSFVIKVSWPKSWLSSKFLYKFENMIEFNQHFEWKDVKLLLITIAMGTHGATDHTIAISVHWQANRHIPK
jgi:hypothetical protein